MNPNKKIALDFMEEGVPTLDYHHSVTFCGDFSPSELLNYRKDNLNENFVFALCAIAPVDSNVERNLKKISEIPTKSCKINYINKVLEMVKGGELDFSATCIVETKELRHLNISLDRNQLNMKYNDHTASAVGILKSVYLGVLYQLAILVHHNIAPPAQVNVIIDRLPSGININLLRNVGSMCYKNPIPFYKGEINVGPLGKGVEDPPELLLADMMAYLHKKSIYWEDPNACEENPHQQEATDSVHGYTEKRFKETVDKFLNYLLQEKECLVMGPPHKIYKKCEEILNSAGIPSDKIW